MNLRREIEDANQSKNFELSATQAKLKMIVHASKYSPRPKKSIGQSVMRRLIESQGKS